MTEYRKLLSEAVTALEEIREIYVGLDGVLPATAPEAYYLKKLKDCYDEAVTAVAVINKALKES